MSLSLRCLWMILPSIGLMSASCARLSLPPFPEPVRSPKTLPVETAAVEADASASPTSEPAGIRITSTPGVVIQRSVAEGIADRLGQNLQGDPVEVTFNDVPLVAFINEVFGELLGMSFVISPGLRRQQDLVTLKLTEPVPPSQLFATARRVLGSYGIDMRQEEDGMLSFFASQEVATRDVPLLVSGRTLPEVPVTHRTIFQLIPLRVARVAYVRGWLLEVFDRQELDVIEDDERNAIVLKGSRDVIERALAMIDVFDQPMLHGRHGIIMEPDFLKAKDLADMLQSILEAEGYNVSVNRPGGSVILLPLDGVDKLVAYALDRAALDRVQEYARILDVERQKSIDNALFTYEVRNTQAEELSATLNQILGGVRPARDRSSSPQDEEQQRTGPMGGRLVVHKNGNLLIFRGSGEEWAEILDIIPKLDKPVPSVLIEVLIAEITLGDDESTGFEFLAKGSLGGKALTAGLGGKGLAVSTLEALGAAGNGGAGTLDSAGQTRAVLNFFVQSSRVAIRSSPRLLVKSGATGNIQVGNEIPTISQIAERGTQIGGAGTNILQQVTYRETGISLEFTPIVQANGLVDLEIAQTLSEARPTAATSLDGTPTILNREISTSMTLRDGGSLLMGGLIADSQSEGQVGVPGLARVPVLGRLFRSDTYQGDRTELVVMVIPYVVSDYREGWDLTERIRDKLELHREWAK